MNTEHQPRTQSERTTYTDPLYCREPGCKEHTKTDRWNRIRSQERGWFFSKQGWATCPLHRPEWLDEWRGK